MNESNITEITPTAVPDKYFDVLNEFSNGGRVEIITGYRDVGDYADLKTIARAFAIRGRTVQITTNIHYKDAKYKQVFGGLIGTPYERKCPDLIIDGVFYEYESFVPPFNKNKISHMISDGARQSPRIIINNNKGCSDRYIINNIGRRLHDITFQRTIEEVWLYERGKLRKIWPVKKRNQGQKPLK
jgi:hypothetical protein